LITFNGVSSTAYSDIVSVQNVKRVLSPGARAQVLDIVGREGSYYFGKDRTSQTVSFRLALKSTAIADRWAAIRQIAYWLDTEEQKVLSFTDEPDLIYYAVLTSPIPVDEFATVGLVDISLFIPDGCAYSDTESTVAPEPEIQTLFLGGADGGTYLLGQVDGLSLPWTEYSTETWASASAL
jgi:predicted phage tail component-like protein